MLKNLPYIIKYCSS